MYVSRTILLNQVTMIVIQIVLVVGIVIEFAFGFAHWILIMSMKVIDALDLKGK